MVSGSCQWYHCANWRGAPLINPYSILLSIGILVGLLWTALIGTQHTQSQDISGDLGQSVTRLDRGLIALLGGMLGARFAFVITHWDYYQTRPQEWFWIWQGGFSWVGALLGSLSLLIMFSLIRRRSFGKIVDSLAIPALIVGISAWLGCWLSGCAYGYRLESISILPASPDYFGNLSPRWPTQLVGGLFCLAMFLGLNLYPFPGYPAGFLTSVTILGLAISTWILSYTRADPIRMIGSMRLDTLSSAVIFSLAAISAITLALRQRNRS